MRDKRKVIELDVNSALALMQEIYNDIVEQKSTASIITKKMLTFMKDAEDMSVIGPVIKDQQKILNDCIEKKISIVKLQGALIKQGSSGGAGNKEGFKKLELNDEDRQILDDIFKEGEDRKKNDDKSEKYEI